MLKRSTLLWPLSVCPLSDFIHVCVLVCVYYKYINKMISSPSQTQMKLCADLCVCVCVVRASQSKQWSQAKWLMEKLHLCKWPLGAVLSVLEGLQGHYTHTFKHTHRPQHTQQFRNECVCVSWRDCGVVTLLMGPYGHKTNTNCSSSLPVIRSWRCWSHSDGETSRRERARGCGLNSQRKVNNLQPLTSTAACIWGFQ